VEEKVKVEVRQILVPTPALTPWRGGSPAWIARVCDPDLRECERIDLVFIVNIFRCIVARARPKLGLSDQVEDFGLALGSLSGTFVT
jgi:hypothetical protein